MKRVTLFAQKETGDLSSRPEFSNFELENSGAELFVIGKARCERAREFTYR